MRNYVSAIIFDVDLLRVLLITELESDKYRGLLNTVGGEAFPGEDSFTAIARHVMGDLGIWIEYEDWLVVGGVISDGSTVKVLTAASDLIDQANFPLKTRTLSIRAVDELSEGLVPNVAGLIFKAREMIQLKRESEGI